MDHKELIKLIDKDPTFDRRLNGSGHYTVRRHGRVVATVCKSPGDHRSLKNTVANLRRAGLSMPR